MIFSVFKTSLFLVTIFIVSFFGFGGMDGPRIDFDGGFGQTSVFVEVADDPAERVQGLRNRPQLGDFEGMWFVFSDSRKRVFTMKDVLIPLDMVFVDENSVVTEIYADRQPSSVDELTYSEFPARYVLELGEGRAAKFGLQPGVQLQFFP